MRSLAARAVVPAAVSVTGFVSVCCLLLYTSIKGDLVSDTIRHETALADTIVHSTRYAMLKADRETLRQTIQDIGAQENVTHVRIFNKEGRIKFSEHPEEEEHLVDKQAAGCAGCHRDETPGTTLGPMDKARRFRGPEGRPVIAITAPIYNEPDCASAACHASVAGQQVLGTLDIGLSADTLEGTLATLRWRMVMFCLMVLILTIGGVSALLFRNVLMPLRKLVVFATELRAGRLSMAAPRGGEEIEFIARVLRDLARRGGIQSAGEGNSPTPGGGEGNEERSG